MTDTTALVSPARTAMIDAAERIVAERGLSALTLRQVQIAAGQSNKSAAQYHFGSRDGLITAILLERTALVEARRRELLDRAWQPGPRELIAALVTPLAERILAHPGSAYGRFLAQSMLDPELAGLIREHLLSRGFLEILGALRDTSSLPAEIASWRVESLAGYVIGALAAAEARSPGNQAPAAQAPTAQDPAVQDPVPTHSANFVAANIIDACHAILTAPVHAA